MRKGLAVTLRTASLVLVSKLALAAPLPMVLAPMHASTPVVQAGASALGPVQGGIRPAVLEIAIPNSVHRVMVHPADSKDSTTPSAKAVQWLTGPVPSRCQRSAGALPSTHACLVI
jgi:hypothetical protein